MKTYPRTIINTHSESTWIIPHAGAEVAKVEYLLRGQRKLLSLYDEFGLDIMMAKHPKIWVEVEASPPLELPVPAERTYVRTPRDGFPVSFYARLKPSVILTFNNNQEYLEDPMGGLWSVGGCREHEDTWIEVVPEMWPQTFKWAGEAGMEVTFNQDQVESVGTDGMFYRYAGVVTHPTWKLIRNPKPTVTPKPETDYFIGNDPAFVKAVSEDVMRGSQNLKLEETPPFEPGKLVRHTKTGMEFFVNDSYRSTVHGRVRWVVESQGVPGATRLFFADECVTVGEPPLESKLDRAIDDSLLERDTPERTAAAASLITKKRETALSTAFAAAAEIEADTPIATPPLFAPITEQMVADCMISQAITDRDEQIVELKRVALKYVETIDALRFEVVRRNETIVKLETKIANLNRTAKEVEAENDRLRVFSIMIRDAIQLSRESDIYGAITKAYERLKADRVGSDYDMTPEPLSEAELARRTPLPRTATIPGMTS